MTDYFLKFIGSCGQARLITLIVKGKSNQLLWIHGALCSRERTSRGLQLTALHRQLTDLYRAFHDLQTMKEGGIITFNLRAHLVLL